MTAYTTTDGSKTVYSYFAETTPGTPLVGAYQTLRSKTGVKFDLKRDTFMSKERRADQMESSMSYGNKSGSGSIPVEHSYGAYDDLYEAAMGGTWDTNVLKMGTTDRSFTIEETATELGITEQIVGAKCTGFSISQKVNGIAEGSFEFGVFRDVRGGQTKGVTVAIDASAKTITRASAGFNTVDGFPLVVAGVPALSVTTTGFSDAGNNVTSAVTTLTDTVITLTTLASGTTASGVTTALIANATIASSLVAATTLAPFDSFTGTIQEGGVAIGHVTGWDLKMEQAVQPNFACGSDSPVSTSTGVKKVSGNLTVLYIDQALRKKFLNGTATSLKLILGSVAAEEAYTFDLGTVKFTSNTRDDSEMARIESMAFAATYTATDTTLKITRTPAT